MELHVSRALSFYRLLRDLMQGYSAETDFGVVRGNIGFVGKAKFELAREMS